MIAKMKCSGMWKVKDDWVCGEGCILVFVKGELCAFCFVIGAEQFPAVDW